MRKVKKKTKTSPNSSWVKVLKQTYYDPSDPGSYGGKDRFVKEVQAKLSKRRGNKNIDRRKIEEWLSEQDAYSLHKPARLHFPRNRVFAPRPLYQFQADLCDMQMLKENNDGMRYILTVIDVFSKKAYARVFSVPTSTGFIPMLE